MSFAGMSTPSTRGESASPIPEFISPRSKVAQMLADIDNATTPPRETARSSEFRDDGADAESPSGGKARKAGHTSSTNGSPFHDHSDEDSDDDGPKPMGRAARRMLGTTSTPNIRAEDFPHSNTVAETFAAIEADDELYSATPRQGQNYKDDLIFPSSPNYAHSNLFVSPAKSSAGEQSDADVISFPLGKSSRFAELVAQKRAERLAKEAEVLEEGEGDPEATMRLSTEIFDEDLVDSQEASNPDIERIMSDAAKPTRKASKKALQEMERETQRIARQQALAHQMKVKKKFTTTSLFSKFNFRLGNEMQPLSHNAENDSAASSVPSSDGPPVSVKDPLSTPPSSPPTPLDRQKALVDNGALSKLVPIRQTSLVSLAEVDDDEELPDLANILSSSRMKEPGAEPLAGAKPAPARIFKLSRLGATTVSAKRNDQSDDELEIIQAMPSHLRAFDKIKGTRKTQRSDSPAIHVLKHLSHIGMDHAPKRGRQGGSRPSIHPQLLEVQLRRRAKEQARTQQLERIAELKAQGIDVQTTEEREREAEEFEDLLEKARQEAVDLRKAEKLAAGGNHESNALASGDESEDEDYVDGSDSDNDDARVQEDHSLVDGVAEEKEDDEELDSGEDELNDADAQEMAEHQGDDPLKAQGSEDPYVSEQDDSLRSPVLVRKHRKSRIVIDDEDEDEEAELISQNLPSAPEYDADEDPFAAFNFGAMPAGSLMSPTQAFNATMRTPTQTTQEDSLDILRQMVPSARSPQKPISSMISTHSHADTIADTVPSSQLPESQQIQLLWETQPPETPVPGVKSGATNLGLETPAWEPTQDDGLPTSWQARRDFQREDTLNSLTEEGTQSTIRIRISESPAPTSTVPPRHRLMRGRRAALDSDENVEVAEEPRSAIKQKNAFREMARKRNEALTLVEREEADKEMKRMMDEQAEESEDEYAGLGGDDFVAPENEQDREMIDSSQIDVDEPALAKLFAERQRVAEEAATSKLYKDLTTGALRRKQANMFDLDEDEDDVAVRRRQMRQREEAKKRRLLLQDDNIAVLAEGKQSHGKDAFLKAIADDDRDDDLLDLSDGEDEDQDVSTQTDSQPREVAENRPLPLQEVSGNKRQREAASEERPPAKQRRTQASAFRAPTSLLQVKESVSFLLDERHMVMAEPAALALDPDSADDDAASDDELGDERAIPDELERQNDGGFAPAREAMPPPRLAASQRRTVPKSAVLDRLSLKRGASISEGVADRAAWAAPAVGGIKVPSLLRRATTNTVLHANERGVTTSNGSSREESVVKMGGSRKSSLAYQARAEERRAIVEASAKRRAENTARIAMLRRGSSSGLGRGLTGHFE